MARSIASALSCRPPAPIQVWPEVENGIFSRSATVSAVDSAHANTRLRQANSGHQDEPIIVAARRYQELDL
jgi:hypothetical protein